MKLLNTLQSISTLIVCIAFIGTAHASDRTISSLQGDINSYQTQATALNQELAATKSKLSSYQEKLSEMQRELKMKEIQLEKMKKTIGKSPTAEQIEFIANESNRMELGETSIKSRKASIERLERKESSLEKKLARINALETKTQNTIASIQRETRETNQAESSAKAYQVKRELEELKKENEQLRLAMAEEAQRVREANIEKKRLAEVAKENELALKEAEAQAAKRALELKTARAMTEKHKKIAAALTQDQSQVVLPGERPIYKRSDGKKVIIRNRGERQSHDMTNTGNNVYQVEVELEPGKAYFDVKRRRYRGYFPGEETDIYIFTYDLSDTENPKLSVARKEDTPDQMISNTNDPF